MTDGSDHTLAWIRRLDSKIDRMLAVLEDQTGWLQRVEGRLTSLAARFAVTLTFDHEVARIDQRLDEHGRRLAWVDATFLAEPST
jgi:hypothetical protein